MIKTPNPKEKHEVHSSQWRKQVLQNKPIIFRPSNLQSSFLSQVVNKSKVIREALDFWRLYSTDLQKFLITVKKRHPLDWRYINRKNTKDYDG